MKYWKFTVIGWGTFWAKGTESEAETWRCAKARWEQTIVRKAVVAKQDLPEGDEWASLKEYNA